MQIHAAPLTLALRSTFRIAHGASDQRHNVITRIQSGEMVGLGEAAAVPYLGESQAGIFAYLHGIDDQLGEDPFLIEEITNRLPAGSAAARASIDLALHDLWGKSLGQPLYRLLGLSPYPLPDTSFTIAIDEPAVMAERAAALDLPVLKIKLGGVDDEAAIAAIRARRPDVRLYVDANAGWDRDQAAVLLPRLAKYGLELVEQPLPVGDIEGLRKLRQLGVELPIFADESVKTARDIAAHAGVVDGVVIKLMKFGGIREALRAIHTARALDMKVMLSCMVESSLGVTAAAHLASLADFLDLDGPLLVANDPFSGVQYQGARLILPNAPGLGVSGKSEEPGDICGGKQ